MCMTSHSVEDTHTCVCQRERDRNLITLVLAAGIVAMEAFGKGSGGKLITPSSRGGDG